LVWEQLIEEQAEMPDGMVNAVSDEVGREEMDQVSPQPMPSPVVPNFVVVFVPFVLL